MSTFEDRLLGEKQQYYVSSSDSEEEAENKVSSSDQLQKDTTHWSGTSTNTGPKGVVQDWQLYKQLEAEKREENEKQRMELAKKLSMTVGTHKDDEKRKQDEQIDAELAELMNDDILLEFQRQRMQEMLKAAGKFKEFGTVFNLSTSSEFLDSIEREGQHIIVVVHVYSNNLEACKTVNKCLETLAKDHKNVKFCKILCSATGMSNNFYENGLPAILVYKGGNLIGNYVKIVKELGDDFFASDLESFLIEKGMLVEKLNILGIN